MRTIVRATVLTGALALTAGAAHAQRYAYVPNYGAGTVSVVDPASGTVAATVPVGVNPNGVAVARDGSWAVVANRGSNTVSVIDGVAVTATVAVGANPAAVSLSPDGTRAYVANATGNSVSVVDLGTAAVVATVPVGNRPLAIAVHPQTGDVFVANQLGDSLTRIDAGTLATTTAVAGDGPQAIEVDPAGHQVMVAHGVDATLRAFDTGTLAQTGSVSLGAGANPQSVAFTPDGAIAYVGVFSPSAIVAVSSATHQVIATTPFTGGVRGVVVAPGGGNLYVATQSPARFSRVSRASGATAAFVALASPRPVGAFAARPLGAHGGIGAGHHHACRVRGGGAAHCWGRDDFGQAVAASGGFRTIVGGSAHSCGLRLDGDVACWGNDDFGQSTPPPGPFVAIAAGFRHVCALREDRTLACWGDDSQGQVTPPPGTYAAVSAGSSHSCAIDTSGNATCWGRFQENQLVVTPGNYVSLALGASFSCGLRTDDTIACWGDDLEGRATPPAGTFTAIDAEAVFGCALGHAGGIQCWGTNAQGQQTFPAGDFAALALGRTSACALDGEGLLDCWGDNAYSQAPRFHLTPGLLAAGEMAQPYAQSVVFAPLNPSSIRPPYPLQSPAIVFDGALPAGITADFAGNLSGTPTEDGDFALVALAQDANGFHAEAPYTLSVTESAPIITPSLVGAAGLNGWFVGNVSLSWTVTDPETAVTSTTGCGPVLVTASTPATGQDFTCSATSPGGTASVTVTVKLDKLKPTLAPTINVAKPLLNQPGVAAAANGTDAHSGVGSASCASADTSTPGFKTVSCTVTDVAGNSASKTVGYRVVYGYVGGITGVSGSWNGVSPGQLVQVGYKLVDFNGAGVTGVGAPTLIVNPQTCPGTPGAAVPAPTYPPGVTDLGSGDYRFVFAAGGTPACDRINFDFGDGQASQRVYLRVN